VSTAAESGSTVPPAPVGPATAAGGGRLRAAADEEMLGIVGAPFALAARLVEESGFDAVYLSGASFSAGLLGVPDIGLFSRAQLVEQTRILTRATKLPVLVDADTGFGDPREVEETVRALEAAGAAAIQIEDQAGTDAPGAKRCGHLGGKRVVEPAEMIDRIAAAVAGRRDAATVIVARSDARGTTSLPDLHGRLRAYTDAGADWLFPEALESRDEFIELGNEFAAGPLLVANMTEFGRGPLISLADLAGFGFGAALYPVTLLRLAMKAMQVGLAILAEEGTQENLLDLMQSREELYDLLGYDPADPGRHLAGPAAARQAGRR